MSHNFFKSINVEELLKENIEVPLNLNFNENKNDIGFNAKFFNSKQNPQDMKETVLPRANQEKLKKNEKAFDAFAKTTRRI